MIQIALLLFGAGFVRSKAYLLTLAGLLWSLLGVAIFIDGLDGVRYFPVTLFGMLLLVESIITLGVASSGIGAQKAVLYFKGGIFCFVALLILSGGAVSNMLLAFLFGFSYFVAGMLQIASSWVVQFPHWKLSLAGGFAHLAFALFLFLPYPTHYYGTISEFIGVTLLVGGLSTLRVSLRARRLREGTSVFELFAPGDLLAGAAAQDGKQLATAGGPEPQDEAAAETQALTVHVWTPEGSSKNAPVPRPIINRYIAAVDTRGVISTGHAALDAPPSTYISLYPAVDIDRSPSEFFRLLKATQDNDVPGEFQPDYATESAAWCPSTRQIQFHGYNRAGLARFWQAYRGKEIYNLTYRNCSSTVAYALEAALDGILAERGRHWARVLRTLFMPELWIAAQVRKRAQNMAWTPGLVSDYARALRAIVHPSPLPWLRRLRQAASQGVPGAD